MNTFLGTLKVARFFLLNLCTSASSIFDPSFGMIAQFICSNLDALNTSTNLKEKTRKNI